LKKNARSKAVVTNLDRIGLQYTETLAIDVNETGVCFFVDYD
jgi:hypothetical protein